METRREDQDFVIEARGLVKKYGELTAVDGIDFAIRAGECFGFLGPNGAGKTSTVKMIHCFAPVTSGTLRVFGLDVGERPREIKMRAGVCQQEDNLDPDFSVVKNLTVFARYFGIPARDGAARARELLDFMGLWERRNDNIRQLSGGLKRRLVIARALINRPDLLILDEPTTGLDPQARRLVWERVRALKRRGTTILLTTHYMEEAAQLCDRLIIMDEGRIIAEGRPADLVATHVGSEVVEVYVSGSAEESAVARLADGPWRSERVGDVLYLYLRDGQASPVMFSALEALDFTRRRATLEDVFLTLTGHALRD